MDVSKVIGNNIKKLMEKEQLSLRKVSEEIGISHPTLSKYVEGSQAIDSVKLMKIASLFNVPFEYFLKENHEEFKFIFRADRPSKEISNDDFETLKKVIINYSHVVENSDFKYEPPRYSFNKFENDVKFFQSIEKIALDQRRLANIENVVPENYYETIRKMGINVICRDLQNSKFFGASSFSTEGGSYIIINDAANISEERKLFSLIHELAHLIFHSDQYSSNDYKALYTSGKNNNYERIANKFAGYFLMPREMVNEFINNENGSDIFAIKKHFKVSIQTVFFVLYDYGFIRKTQYDKFWRDINYLGYKEVEPNPLPTLSLKDKNAKIYRILKDLYLKEEIGANKISEVLGLDIIETRKILKEWETMNERNFSIK